MTDGLEEVRRLAANLGRIAGSAVQDVDGVAKKGALNIKQEMSYSAVWSRHFKGMASAISFDSAYRPGVVRYEVGPDKNRPGGALGNIAYFGTSRGGGTLDIEQPLASEGPRFQSALEALAARWAGQL